MRHPDGDEHAPGLESTCSASDKGWRGVHISLSSLLWTRIHDSWLCRAQRQISCRIFLPRHCDSQSPPVLDGCVSNLPLDSSSLGTPARLILMTCARELLPLLKRPSGVLIMDCTFKLFQNIEALAAGQGWSSCRPAWPLGEAVKPRPLSKREDGGGEAVWVSETQCRKIEGWGSGVLGKRVA